MSAKNFHRFASLLIALALAVGGYSPALAAPPDNDDFDFATVVSTVPFTANQNTVEATSAPDDPTSCTNNGSVWFSFTPPVDMLIDADTIGSSFDTVLSVYTGTRGALTQVPGGCNDDYYALQSRITFNATAGTTYHFLIGVCCGGGSSGGGNLTFSLQEIIPPDHDDFADADQITTLPFSASVNTAYASTEFEEPLYWCYTIQRTIWYSFTPTETMAITVDTLGSDTDASINIYRSSGLGFSNLNFINCTGSYAGSYTFLAEANQTYYFQASLFPGQIGTLQINVEQVPPPANDNFADATNIPEPLAFIDDAVTLTGSVEPGEPIPSCGFTNDNTIWYAYVPSESGTIMARSIANFETIMAVYTGNSLSTLTEIGCRPHYSQPLIFSVNAGTRYYIQVGDLYGNGGGSLQFRLEVPPPPSVDMSFYPFDPSVFNYLQFCSQAYDPASVGFQSLEWDFGDGTTASGYCVSHRYAADGDYTVRHTGTTFDGRSATASRIVNVRTHDVSIVRVLAPRTANAGQTRTITVSINNKKYPETVTIDLYRSVAGGNFEWVATLTKTVPATQANRSTDFSFSYMFSQQDTEIGKVTFKAIVNIVGAQDSFPGDNQAISTPPTTVR